MNERLETGVQMISLSLFVLVNSQKTIEKELGMQITDSGIGNPQQVR